MKWRQAIIDRIDTYLNARGISPRQFGVDAVGDSKFLPRLRAGVGITLTTIERAEAYIFASGDDGAQIVASEAMETAAPTEIPITDRVRAALAADRLAALSAASSQPSLRRGPPAT